MDHYAYSDYNDWRHDAIGHYSELLEQHKAFFIMAISGITTPLTNALCDEGEEYFAEVIDTDRIRDIADGNWDYTLEALFDRIGGEASLRDDSIAWAA